MYAQRIRDKLDPQHKGKFLVIDIEYGCCFLQLHSSKYK